jgi:signal transduction histidine kinase/DNA-binding response OmpR family regulator
MVDGDVLVVDDEPQILLLISRFLQRSGYKVETAENGMLALERLSERPFALILSDLKMPHMDGVRLLQEVRERHPDTLFILMTGFATLDSAVSVLRHGAYDYLTKPLDLDDLRSTVRRALEHHALLLQNKRLMEFLQEKNVVLEFLHREEQHKSRQLNQVNAIARQISTVLDVEQLVSLVVDLIKPAFDFTSLSFGLIEEETLLFRRGRLDGKRERVQESVLWRLTDGGHRAFVHPSIRAMSHSHEEEPLPESLEEEDAAHELIFPLRAGEKTVGFWVADWSEDAQYRDENLAYLESLAAQTVVMLQNARLYALARQADEMAFLNEVARAANQRLDLEETIRSVLSCVQATFNAPLVEICLLNEQGKIQSVFTLVQDAFERSSMSLLGNGFVRRVKEDPLIFRESMEIGQVRSSETEPLGLRSRLGVSLQLGERQIGVLGLGSVDPGTYGPEDGRLLQVVGGQAATAIENARLFQEVESGRQVILQSRDTLQTLFDGILEGIYIVDRDKETLAINRTQAGWARSELADLVGQSAQLAFPTSECSLALIEETFESGRPVSRTERQRMEDGRWTEWEIHTYPIASPDLSQRSGSALADSLNGDQDRTTDSAEVPQEAEKASRVDRVVVVVRDVTEQRWLEASLIQSEKLAAVGRLAAGVAHEINNPMTVISANIQILREEIPSDHAYYGSIELINRASERTSKIVRNLLDFSRAEQFEFVPTDLNRSLRDAISLVESQILKSNIQVVTALDPALPPIWASPDHLHVVWLNLLLNARDAIEEAEREGWIRVTSRRRRERAVVQISDNGMGIPSHVLGRIYDPFFTTKPPGKGTGLGLFTCYRTVIRHGGEISVDSRVGMGTTFDISLPVRQERLSDE